MDFAATRKNTGANIVNAGNAAGNALTSFLETSRQAAPDYTQLSALNIAAQSSKAATAVEAEAKVRANKIELEARTKAYDKVSKAKSDAERWVKKAGMLAGMGQLAIEATKKKKDPPPPVEIIPTKIVVADNEDIDKVTAEATKTYDELLQNMPKPSTSGSSPPPSSTSSTSSAPITGGSLSGNSKIVADAVAGPESGPWGYEAFNQGGAKDGTKVLGKRGSHKETFGTSLTGMTLNEIFKRQNTRQQGLSFQEHLDSGGLHAVGRYQFIGDTLQDEVRRMGLDPKTTKFTPEVQDQIFLSHIKRVGNISPWVGPSRNWDKSKKDYINGLVSTL